MAPAPARAPAEAIQGHRTTHESERNTADMSTTPALPIAEFCALTDTGRQRAENQDCAVAEDLGVERGCLLLVCDGMGGHAGGAIASHLATEAVQNSVRGGPPRAETLLLRAALQTANDAVRNASRLDPSLSSMGTTCVAALVQDADAWIANVGDSRAYRITPHKCEQLTQDHTLLYELVRGGHNIPNIETHPDRNIITRCIGVDHSVAIDMFQCHLEPGDVLLLCSDGLTAHVDNHEFARAFDAQTVREAVHVLVGLANLRGGSDNISIAALRRTIPGTCVPHAVADSAATPAFLMAGLTPQPGHGGSVGSAEGDTVVRERQEYRWDSSAEPGRASHAAAHSADGDSTPAPHNAVSRSLKRLGIAALIMLALVFSWLYFFSPC